MDARHGRAGDAVRNAPDNMTSIVQIEYDAEKVEALRFYLGDRNTTLEKELEDALDGIFKKTVPAQVREYINRNNAPTMKTGKSE